MALASIYRVVQDVSGNVVPEVLGTVLVSGTATLATLFADQDGTVPLPNPLSNNATYGSFSVFVGAGLYDFQFIKVGYTFETQRNIAVRDPAAGVNVLSGTANQVIVTPASGIGAVTLSTPQNLDPDAGVQFGRLGMNTPAPTLPLRLFVNGNGRVEKLGVGIAPNPGGTEALDVQGNTLLRNELHVTGVSRFDGAVGIAIAAPTATYALDVNGAVLVRSSLTVNGLTALASLSAGATQVSQLQASGNTILTTTQVNSLGVNVAAPATAGQSDLRGPVGIQEAPLASSALTMTYNKVTQFGQVFHTVGSDTGNFTVVFVNVGGSVVGSINAAAAATAFNTSSDRRLKVAIVPLPEALARVLALRPVAFQWKADGTPGVGFVADEVAQTVPEAVTGEPDALDAEGRVLPQQLDMTRLIPYLVATVQQLAQQMQGLETRLSAAGG